MKEDADSQREKWQAELKKPKTLLDNPGNRDLALPDLAYLTEEAESVGGRLTSFFTEGEIVKIDRITRERVAFYLGQLEAISKVFDANNKRLIYHYRMIRAEIEIKIPEVHRQVHFINGTGSINEMCEKIDSWFP